MLATVGEKQTMNNWIERPWYSTKQTLGAAVVVFGLSIGTGGHWSIAYAKELEAASSAPRVKLYCVTAAEDDSRSLLNAQSNPLRDIQIIRKVLQPTIKEMAQAFGVSRQAIYDWLDGKPIAPSNVQRIRELAKAADYLQSNGITLSSQDMHRPIRNGLNIFECLAEGDEAVKVAQRLVLTLRIENEQRKVLETRLAGRTVINTNSKPYHKDTNDKA
jgi:hypothetical protein